ncbi:hypothetical protein CDL12_28887 [Handroanthus impetiginosus]|uniref:Uncharacterized protein n=1 Tax=Handroanthus impetiginosus TaxID=429701 RepID=A0A2G9G013_9LAMI|nr:hypothetical protein CDL12_28887 [Handroanthus impetiginosus]
MSQCIVPNWHLKQERQEEQVVEGGEGRNRSPHVHSDQNLSYVVPMSNYEVTELTWENGQVSLHGLGGIASPNSSITPQTKQSTWNSAKPGGTLESIVHQATTFSKNYNIPQNVDQVKWSENSNSHVQMIEQNGDGLKVNSNIYSDITNSGGKWGREKSAGATTSLSGGGLMRKKRVRSELEQNCDRKIMNSFEESDDQSGTATFCKVNTHTSTADTTMMTWPPSSFGSPCRSSFKTAPCRNTDEDSACHCSVN